MVKKFGLNLRIIIYLKRNFITTTSKYVEEKNDTVKGSKTCSKKEHDSFVTRLVAG